MIKSLLLLAVALACGTLQAAEPFPGRPITLVVPQPAGGAADALARTLGEEMGRRLGTTFIVENRPGASGMLGTNVVARAKPDGHTLLVTNSTPVLTLPYMFDKVPYDVNRDLRFITQISSGQLVLVVNHEIPARNMKEFMDWAAQNRGKVNYGSFGVGTSGHLVASYLSHSRGLDMTHVPFKGEVPLIQELVGGRVSWGFDPGAGGAAFADRPAARARRDCRSAAQGASQRAYHGGSGHDGYRVQAHGMVRAAGAGGHARRRIQAAGERSARRDRDPRHAGAHPGLRHGCDRQLG